MPLYMDIHRDVEGTPEDVAEAHRKDLETQDAQRDFLWGDDNPVVRGTEQL